MTTRSFLTSDDQERVLQWIVNQMNAETVMDKPLTVDAFIQKRFPELLAPFMLQFAEWERQQVSQKFTSADSKTQQTVRDTLQVM